MAGVILLGHTAQAKGKPSITAESAVVMDVQSGTILYEKNKNKKEYPASITKIMTGLLALENSSLSETVTYSRNAVTNLEYKASNIDIKPGEKLSMEDSLYGILLMSANEACNGVAEHIAGSVDNFVDMMNAKAKELGCTGTHFANANGLWMKNHYTTAYDMALIARAAFRNSDFAKITGTKRYNIEKTNKSGKRYLYNHHGMLYPSTFSQYLYKYCVGGKTGYTEKCRYTLVTYAKKDDMTLVAVIMKAPNSPWTAPDANEYTDTTKLLNYCFENYDRYEVEEDATATVNSQYLFNRFSPYYNEETTPLSVEEDASVMLPKGVALEKAKKKIELYDQAKTVTSTKKNIGKITYTYKGKEVGGAEIYYDTKEQATLNDSIDMSAWFDDAVEKANQSPFPWKKLIFVVVLLLMAGGVTFLVLWWMRVHKEQRVRRNHFRRTRRNRRKNERKKFTNRRKKL
jgi:D-alanyl-D-alanine carboxypeptidase